jgi:hypothetical protein
MWVYIPGMGWRWALKVETPLPILLLAVAM